MPPEHTVFQEPPQEKVWYSKVGRPSTPSDVAETRDNSSEHFTNNSHTVSYHMKWRPLLCCSPCRQPRQAIAPTQYSNSKCVSRLRATLYKHNTSVNNTTFILYKMVYMSGRHISTLLGHPRALQENRSESCLCFIALWDPKCLQVFVT